MNIQEIEHEYKETWKENNEIIGQRVTEVLNKCKKNDLAVQSIEVGVNLFKITAIPLLNKQPQKKDYSKWIGRDCTSLAIKGNKFLKSQKLGNEGSITYSGIYNEEYNKPINYEEVSMSDLKYGDVVCFYPESKENNLHEFGIFMGINSDNKFHFTRLVYLNDLEYLDNLELLVDKKVHRFLRE